ncbi:MAG: dihydrodipicolinate synthase family protein [Cyclobacteriaceae bacterium]
MQNIHGLISAAFTPFKSDGSVNYDHIPTQIQQLVQGGVVGTLVCGSTGEGYSLSIQERKKITEVWIHHCPDDFLLFAHVGHNAIPEAKLLAQEAHELGVAGIIVSAPMYFKPSCVEDLVAFCAAIVEGIKGTPVYYYHIPSLSGVSFSMRRFMELASESIPDFRGIKYTYEDLDEVRQCMEYQPEQYEIIFGRDEILLDALQLGITGAMGSTYNYMAPLFNQIITSFNAGDLPQAKALQQEAQTIIDVLVAYGGGIVAGKALMEILGMGCGPLRLPLGNLSAQEMKEMEAAFMKTNLMQYVNNLPVEK